HCMKNTDKDSVFLHEKNPKSSCVYPIDVTVNKLSFTRSCTSSQQLHGSLLYPYKIHICHLTFIHFVITIDHINLHTTAMRMNLSSHQSATPSGIKVVSLLSNSSLAVGDPSEAMASYS
ncbi:hypothetical protein GOP47_0013080, partial [Adiantum capillus-veneris]